MRIDSTPTSVNFLSESWTEPRTRSCRSSLRSTCPRAHAGDDATLIATLESAKKHRARSGAHPSYPDRAGFGREPMELPPIELARELRAQLTHLSKLSRSQAGVLFRHVKPHGALYNLAAVDEGWPKPWPQPCSVSTGT